MRTRAGTEEHRLERLVRVVPSLVLLVLLVLAALLLAARSAHAAAQAPLSTIPLALDEEGEGEGEFENEFGEEEACEEAEEEFEEGGLGETEVESICEVATGEDPAEGAATGSTASDRCSLRSVHPRAVTVEKGRRLKLTIGYTTFAPSGATVEIRLGATRIGSFRRHLGRSGVLRIVMRLGKQHTPRRLVLHLRIAGSKRQCSGAETQRVRIRRKVR